MSHAAHDIPIENTSILSRASAAMIDIKLAHSVFAMPFALLGAFLVRPIDRSWTWFAIALALVAVCMFFARTWAMLVNRLADRQTDAYNPRTASRAIPAGRLRPKDVVVMAIGAAVLFIACTSLFGVLNDNWWPAALSVPVLAWIALYSFTKRFTWACHLFLGSALAISPIAAAIAINPGSLTSALSLYWLSGMVLLWVAGFDVIYALADIDFDRSERISSIPSRFGWSRAIWISRVMHTCAFVCIALAWRLDPRLGTLFLAAIAIVGSLLIAEHTVLAKRGKAGLDIAFFTLNGIVSVILGLAGIADVLAS